MTEWKEWNGEGRPNLLPETMLEIRTTAGGVGQMRMDMCAMMPDWWSDQHGARFIAAYRVLEPDVTDNTVAGQAFPSFAV